MKINRNQWKSMKINGKYENMKKKHGNHLATNQLKPMKINGKYENQLSSIEIYENQ